MIAAYLQIDCNLCYVNITFIDQAEIQTISRVFTIKETWEKKKHFIYKNIVLLFKRLSNSKLVELFAVSLTLFLKSYLICSLFSLDKSLLNV